MSKWALRDNDEMRSNARMTGAARRIRLETLRPGTLSKLLLLLTPVTEPLLTALTLYRKVTPVSAFQVTAVNTGNRISALAVWLCAFFSPTAYFLLLLCVDKFHVAAPPEILVASLFFFIPVAALLVCEYVAWRSSKTISRKIGWMLFTFVAMLLQFGVLLVIIIAAISAAIGYAQ